MNLSCNLTGLYISWVGFHVFISYAGNSRTVFDGVTNSSRLLKLTLMVLCTTINSTFTRFLKLFIQLHAFIATQLQHRKHHILVFSDYLISEFII